MKHSSHLKPIYLKDVQIDGIDTKDYPDFVDAYLTYAYHTILGRPLNDNELEYVTDTYPDFINQSALDQIF